MTFDRISYALLVGIFIATFAAIGVYAYVRRCHAQGRHEQARRAITYSKITVVVGLAVTVAVLLYQTITTPPVVSAAKAIYICHRLSGEVEGVCAGIDDGRYVEFRAEPGHPKLLDGSHDVHWASPATTACGQAHQFVAPLLKAAADELEAHRPYNVVDIGTVLSQGEAERLVNACGRSSINSLLVLNVTGLVLTAADPSAQTAEELETRARHLREQLATGEGD